MVEIVASRVVVAFASSNEVARNETRALRFWFEFYLADKNVVIV